ncbi:MAG: hypothetical protein FJZ58_01790 [Chlamydiae bacterium]|nr:hypothetical protein [Chlamydiota bacterium]
MKRAIKPLFAFFLTLTAKGFSTAIPHPPEQPETPWFTGPIIGTNAHTVPPGHFIVEPYVYFFQSSSTYNEHWHKIHHPSFYTLIERVPLITGITSFMDGGIVPQFFYQFTQGVRSAQCGDMPFFMSFQLWRDQAEAAWPAVRFILRSTIPWGKYDRLSPEKLGTDGVGTGSWMPGVGLAMSRLFTISPRHFFSPRFSINYSVPCSIPVRGMSVYGGASDTRGKVYGGNIFWTDLGLEYTLTQSWVLAMDIYYQHTNAIHFKGYPGDYALVGRAAQEQLSLVPAIEYNWSVNMGIIVGSWFTILGRNTPAFTSAVAAFNLYY